MSASRGTASWPARPTRTSCRAGSGASSKRPTVGSPLSICYVPKGPIMDYGDRELTAQVLEATVQTARRQRAIYVKIDPDVPLGDEGALDVLCRQGFRPGESIQRPNTMMLDVRGSEEDVLGRMK